MIFLQVSLDQETADPDGHTTQEKGLTWTGSKQATHMAYQGLKAPESRGQKETPDLPPHQEMGVLTFAEKKILLAVERGDVATTRR